MLKYKPDMKKAMEHYELFWNKENTDRCNLAIMIPRENPRTFPPARPYALKDLYTDPECIMNRYLNSFERTQYLYEAMPIVKSEIGNSGQCYYLGC